MVATRRSLHNYARGFRAVGGEAPVGSAGGHRMAELRLSEDMPVVANELRHSYGWFLVLGIALIVLGGIAIVSAVVTTQISVVLIGWLLIIAGIMTGVNASRREAWGGFFLDLFTGVLYTVAGFIIAANPQATAVAYTLVIALFLMVSGIFRAVAGAAMHYPYSGWTTLHGIVAFLLGVAIWREWPISGEWLIGFYIGIELVLNGVTLAMLGFAARKLARLSGE